MGYLNPTSRAGGVEAVTTFAELHCQVGASILCCHNAVEVTALLLVLPDIKTFDREGREVRRGRPQAVAIGHRESPTNSKSKGKTAKANQNPGREPRRKQRFTEER
jgi:hypothetical protein